MSQPSADARIRLPSFGLARALAGALRRRLPIVLKLGLSICVWAAAVDAHADAAVWTLERAGSEAIARSPEVRKATVSLEAARAYRVFGTIPWVGNPQLSVRAMFGRPDQSAATYSGMLGVPFDVSGRRRAYKREASWVEREAEAQLAVAENEARSEARSAFVDVVLGLEAERVAVANTEVAADFLARVKARFDAKAATALDMALSQRDYAESKAAVAHARTFLVEARGRFRQVLDLAAGEAFEVAALPELRLPTSLSLEHAVELALSHRRDALVASSAAERARAADDRLRRETIAPMVIAGEYEAQANDNTQTSGGVGLSAELPLILKNQGERAQMRARGNVYALDSELTKRRVAREATNALLALEAALGELSAIAAEATPAAEQALAMTMEMLEVGAIDFFRLLNARASAFSLRARRVEILRSAWHQRIALERSLGGLLEAL